MIVYVYVYVYVSHNKQTTLIRMIVACKDAPPSYADCVTLPTRQAQQPPKHLHKRHTLLAILLIVLKASIFAALGYLMITAQGPFQATDKQIQDDLLSQYKTSNAVATVLVIVATAWMGVVRRLGPVSGLGCVVAVLVDSYLTVFVAANAGPSGSYIYGLLVPNVGSLYLYVRLGKD